MLNRIIAFVLIIALLSTVVVVHAGSPIEPGTAPGATYSYTLADLYSRLTTGAVGAQSAFTEPSSGPGSGTMQTLNDIMAVAPIPDDDNGATTANVPSGKTFWGLTTGQWGTQTGTAANGTNVSGGNGQLSFPIPDGFYSGSKSCTASDANLVAGNIKSGTTIFGVAGSYVCQAGQTFCGGTCVNISTDDNNCGACGFACSSGYKCNAGTCALSCPPGQVMCAGVCTNINSDVNSCGMCGLACFSGYKCVAGTCALSCQLGLSVCGGVCTNLNTDNNSCGACGFACPVGTGCHNGTCS